MTTRSDAATHRWLLPTVLMICGCGATSFYPKRDFMGAELPPVEEDHVEVLFEADAEPSCPYREMGVIVYDSAKDGAFTSEEVALQGIRERAADLGASGVYKLERMEGAVVGMAQSVGQATTVGSTTTGMVTGFSAAGKEVGLRAVAYLCAE